MINTKKIAFWGVHTAMALVLGYIEHLIPFPVGIYGVKLGLSNLATVVILYLCGGTAALTLNFIRIFLSSLLFGNAVSLIYSLCGGIFAAILMIIAKRIFKISCVGVSIIGGISHNMAQLAVAIALVSSFKIAFYLPVLLLSGAITGFIIGVSSIPIINNKYLFKYTEQTKETKKR